MSHDRPTTTAGILLLSLFAVPTTARAQSAPTPKPAEQPVEKEEERGLKVCEADSCDGLTFIQPLRSKSLHLVDYDGTIVHTWEMQQTPCGMPTLLPDGTLLRGGHKDEKLRFHAGGIGGVI